MAAYQLLLSLIALSCFLVSVNSRVLNYDVNEDFNQALLELGEVVGDGVGEGLTFITHRKGELQGRAKIDVDVVLIKFFMYEESGRRDLSKLVNENNKECINKAVKELEGVKHKVTPNILSCLKEYVEETEKIATEGLDSIMAHLRIPDKFHIAFEKCVDDDCKAAVVADVIKEIPISKKIIEDTVDIAALNLWFIWDFNSKCIKVNDIEFLQISVNIINDAKNTCV